MADPANIEAIQDTKAEEARRATHEWAVPNYCMCLTREAVMPGYSIGHS